MRETALYFFHCLEQGIGWIFSPSWIPPSDFELLRWLIIPGYGYGAILIIMLVLEWVRPAQRRPWGRAWALSATYLFFSGKLGLYAVVVTPLFRNAWVLAGLPSLHLDLRLPWPVYMSVSLLVLSFAAYWAHRLMHRVPVLWHIHKIHHSIVNLNCTSPTQHHFLEGLLHVPFTLVFVLLMGTDLVAPFGMVYFFVDHLGHSNINVDLGRLSYLISTPQAHRIHHSVHPEHFNSNFGNVFMVWDLIFGTFRYDPANPPTAFGIDEKVPLSFVKQQLLPIAWIGRDAVASSQKLASSLSRTFSAN